MKVLVTGANGQLGWELQQDPPAGVELIALDRLGLDITDPAAVEQCLAHHKPQQLINCAAYTAVDRAESEPDRARAINATGAANLAHGCRQHQCRLIHISTDFVFDGRQSTPYKPDDTPNPQGVYGQTKWEGEQQVQQLSEQQALILRTGWVYSTHGNNFIKTMLRLMQERDQLSIVDDQIGTPSWAHNIAAAIWGFVDQPQLSGTLHYSDSGVASWYDLAVAIQQLALPLGLLEREIPLTPIPTSAYPTPAQRPHYSVLDKQQTWQQLGYQAPHWREALKQMLMELQHLQ